MESRELTGKSDRCHTPFGYSSDGDGQPDNSLRARREQLIPELERHVGAPGHGTEGRQDQIITALPEHRNAACTAAATQPHHRVDVAREDIAFGVRGRLMRQNEWRFQ